MLIAHSKVVLDLSVIPEQLNASKHVTASAGQILAKQDQRQRNIRPLSSDHPRKSSYTFGPNLQVDPALWLITLCPMLIMCSYLDQFIEKKKPISWIQPDSHQNDVLRGCFTAAASATYAREPPTIPQCPIAHTQRPVAEESE